MADLSELKEYVAVHASGQRIKDAQEILARISSDDQDAPGSWVHEWSRAGQALEQRGRFLGAARYYAMARFPYVDGPARALALERCVRATDRWRMARGGDIIRMDLDLPEGRVGCWAGGLSLMERRPLLLISGGIVSIKEQWAAVIPLYRRFGLSVVVTEMPGAGENTLRYDAESWRMFPAVVDAIAERADIGDVYAIALSFSGHMALRWAAEDSRIKGIVTAGAPVTDFFTDAAWQAEVPAITTETLAHLAAVQPAGLFPELKAWALTGELLAGITAPVRYLQSSRDEIIPAGETAALGQHIGDLRVAVNDDVHGSPGHVPQSQLWALTSALELCGVSDARTAIFRLLLGAFRARGRLSGALSAR
jgi:pimeloyl-ACP methyl ester carboxylesterase